MKAVRQRFRILHYFYRRGGAAQHWFSRRIRPSGIGVLLVVSFASFMSIGQSTDSIVQIFAFSLGLALLALFWVALRGAKLSAAHELPRHATAGEPLRYTVKLENLGSRKLIGARIADTPPDPRPSLMEFAQLREPGEERRNAFDRTMAYYRWQWLTARKRGFFPSESESEILLEPGETKRVSMRITPLRRGVIAMNDLRVLLPDPMGFFQKCKKVESRHARLVVLPRRYRLPHFVMPGSAAFRIGGEETSNAIGTAGEFVGLRDYRPGDPLRQIHWKSWAHTGKPMVKELEDTFYPRYALVLDTFPGSSDEQTFEDLVSVAASFIVGLDHSQSLLDLMFIADEAHTVTAGRGMDRTEKLLEVLAGVQMEEKERFEILARTVSRHREQMTSCLLMLNGWDKAREDFVKQLLKGGIICVPLVIGPGERPPGVIGYWLESGEIARDLLRLPSRLSAAM
jgi:uncharacterized protein (DUF58 family)